MREVEYRRMFGGPGAYEHEELFIRDYFAETVSDVDAMEQLKARIENMYFELQRQRENERHTKSEKRNQAIAKQKEQIDILRERETGIQTQISNLNQEVAIINQEIRDIQISDDVEDSD